MYALKQAPRGWYKTLSTFLIEFGYKRRVVDPTLFQCLTKNHFILVQIYMDDIILSLTNQVMVDDFAKLMTIKF